jgi:hypothetical protein
LNLQNQPNPFSEATVISWQLPVSSQQPAVRSRVELRVFDFMGQEIRTLIDADMIPGDHHVTFNASGLAAGVYFYQLQVDGLGETKNMVVER